MRTTNLSLDNDKNHFELMWKLLKYNYSKKQVKDSWVFARLEDWKYNLYADYKLTPDFFIENARLWFDDFGELLGFAISEDGTCYFDITTKYGYEYLYKNILCWIKDNWGYRHKELTTNIYEDELIEKGFLINEKFNYSHIDEITREFLLKDCNDSPDNIDGYRILGMDESENWDSLKLLYNKAFNNKQEINAVDKLVMDHWKKTTSFNPHLLIVATNENGDCVSTCYAFIDFDNKMAEIEKVCTLSENRRKGLAKTVIKECFYRLNKIGIKKAYITGGSEEAIATYGKVGEHTSRNSVNYTLKL